MVVLERVLDHPDKRHRYWLCKCDCGRVKAVAAFNLRAGRVQSCGCLREEGGRAAARKEATGASICWDCIHSAAPKELQCIWDESKGKILPDGAEYIEKPNIEGSCKRVISCPLFERINTEGRPKE